MLDPETFNLLTHLACAADKEVILLEIVTLQENTIKSIKNHYFDILA